MAEANEVKLRLEGRMKNLKKRNEYLTKIRNIDRKVAWILHDVLKIRLQEVKQLKQRSLEELEQKRHEIGPMQGAVNNARKMIDTMLGKITNSVLFEKCEIVNYKFNSINYF